MPLAKPLRTGLLVPLALAVLVGCVPPPSSGPSESASPLPSVGQSGSPSASSSGTPASSPAPTTPEEQYCVDYRTILGAGEESQLDDQGMNFDRLSAWLDKMITNYQAASKNAPTSLDASYREVVQFLKDFKVTVDSKDQEAVIAQMRYLPKLNSSMEKIRKTSEKMCR